MSAEAHHHQRDAHHVRRNFVCHVLEGGLYMGGTAFLAPESVLPKMVQSLGGKPWVIAVMPVLLPAAFACMGLFIAPVVERLTRFKPWVLGFGLLQRLPYLVTGLILLLGKDIDEWLLPLVVLTPLVSGLIGGVTVVAWMEMVTRMVPEKVRAAGWSARYILQACLAVGAGMAIHWVLTHVPGREGYAWLHLAAFALLFLSWTSQLPMREPLNHEVPPRTTRLRYRDYLRSLPALFATQQHLKKLVLARFLGTGFLMLVSFLTIHALHVTGRPEADEGHFVTSQAVGTVLGSLIAGYVGYFRGGKVLMLASRIVCLALCGWVMLNDNFSGFTIAYFALGLGLFIDRVGDLTLAAELCPVVRRSTLQAMLSFCNVFSLLLSSFIAGQVYRITESFHAVAWLAGGCAIASMLVLIRIPEPRDARVAPVPDSEI
ncbi:MAG: MFS transporter [Verrucomicrobiota bacterium]